MAGELIFEHLKNLCNIYRFNGQASFFRGDVNIDLVNQGRNMLRCSQDLIAITPPLFIKDIPVILAQSFCQAINSDRRTLEIVGDGIGKELQLL